MSEEETGIVFPIEKKAYTHGIITSQFLTKTELANRLNKSARTIEIWGQRGILPYIKVQRSILYDWKDVVKALSSFSSKGRLR